MTQAALITGGAIRIGKAITLALAEQGYDIALHYYQSLKEARTTARLVEAKGCRCHLIKTDLRQARGARLLLRAARKHFPTLRLLVNNASVFAPSSLKKGPTANLKQQWAIHFFAPYALIQEFARQCRKGTIINLLDTRITKNRTKHAQYLLSKKALAELTAMAAVEMAPDIRVNGIAPGLILPPEGKKSAYLDRLARAVPLKRKGNPADITQTVRFLLESDYITGQIIYVDGGEHLV